MKKTRNQSQDHKVTAKSVEERKQKRLEIILNTHARALRHHAEVIDLLGKRLDILVKVRAIDTEATKQLLQMLK